MRRLAITGMGVVNPCGIGAEAFWNAVALQHCAITPQNKFDHSRAPAHVAAPVPNFDPSAFTPPHLLGRIGLITHLALAASSLALTDAGLDPAAERPDRIGLSLGTTVGSWTELEQGLHAMSHDGSARIGKSLGLGWFAGAPLGQVSIQDQLRGYSKVYVADRASGGCALHYGARSILDGRNDVVLIGGAEAPLTPFGTAYHGATGELSPSRDPQTAYLPFTKARSGTVLGEGATVLVIEDEEHAQRRKARIYGWITGSGVAMSTPRRDGLTAALASALHSAGRSPDTIDAVFTEAAGTREGDRLEAQSITDIFTHRVAVTAPRALYGHLMAAAFATDIACALLSARHGTLPGLPPSATPDPVLGIDIATRPRALAIDAAVINSRSCRGLGAAAVVTANPVQHEEHQT